MSHEINRRGLLATIAGAAAAAWTGVTSASQDMESEDAIRFYDGSADWAADAEPFTKTFRLWAIIDNGTIYYAAGRTAELAMPMMKRFSPGENPIRVIDVTDKVGGKRTKILETPGVKYVLQDVWPSFSNADILWDGKPGLRSIERIGQSLPTDESMAAWCCGSEIQCH